MHLCKARPLDRRYSCRPWLLANRAKNLRARILNEYSKKTEEIKKENRYACRFETARDPQVHKYAVQLELEIVLLIPVLLAILSYIL